MVMEALEGYSQMIRYEIMVCHTTKVNQSLNVAYIIVNQMF